MSKPIGQKIALGFAVISYACAIAFALGALLYESTSEEDAVRAALMASIVFFVGCGVVLQVIGTARLKGVLSGSGDIDPQ
jgi:pantoate kinase